MTPALASWDLVRPVLERASRFAFDLEGDFNLHRYGRRICLFQVAVDDGSVFLLDPMDAQGAAAWSGWKELLESPQVQKVIWASQNDVRVLKACHGVAIRGLWDLFDAAALTVMPRPSLPALVKMFLDVDIEKEPSLQTGDWNQRPLSDRQLTYAAQDVQYLLPLADALQRVLDADPAKAVAFQKRMVKAEGFVFHDEAEPWKRWKGAGLLDDAQQADLARLWASREIMAAQLDLAPWKLAPHEDLVFRCAHGIWPELSRIDPRWIVD